VCLTVASGCFGPRVGYGRYGGGYNLLEAAVVTAVIVSAVAPPPPQVVIVPEPRVGYVWQPGYWTRQNDQWVWFDGTWVQQRPSGHYEPTHWVQQPDGSWQLYQGQWVP
jgi:hypothetical protein